MLLLGGATAAAQPFSFATFGDMPYCNPRDPEGCRGEVARMEGLVDRINTARPAFSVFLGDTKGGGESCADAVILERTAALFDRVEGALVYTPGDNEWTDCWQPRAGAFDPLERLQRLRGHFFAAPRSLGRTPMPLVRQADGSDEHRLYVENARWEWNSVLFATVHVPGSDNNRPRDEAPGTPPGAAAEYPARNRANLDWIADTYALAERDGHRAVVFALQADLYYRDRCGRGTIAGHLDTRRAVAEGARRLGRPVLLLHGDSHFYLQDHPVPEAPNLTRLMVPGVQDIRAVLVTVDPAATDPLRFALLGQADRPAAAHCG